MLILLKLCFRWLAKGVSSSLGCLICCVIPQSMGIFLRVLKIQGQVLVGFDLHETRRRLDDSTPRQEGGREAGKGRGRGGRRGRRGSRSTRGRSRNRRTEEQEGEEQEAEGEEQEQGGGGDYQEEEGEGGRGRGEMGNGEEEEGQGRSMRLAAFLLLLLLLLLSPVDSPRLRPRIAFVRVLRDLRFAGYSTNQRQTSWYGSVYGFAPSPKKVS